MINPAFKQADIPISKGSDPQLRPNEQIVEIDGKRYVQWHDLIDIRVPLFTDANLLHSKRVVLPLHGRAPRAILTQIDKDWWDRTRKRVYEIPGRHCHCCGVHQSQQAGYVKNQMDCHEVYAVNYELGESTIAYFTCLCKMCHSGIHFGRLTAQRDSGKIQEKSFYAVVSHCNSVLRRAELPLKNWDTAVDDNIYKIPWDKWHLSLVINGEKKDFYSLYKNEEELNAAYA